MIRSALALVLVFTLGINPASAALTEKIIYPAVNCQPFGYHGDEGNDPQGPVPADRVYAQGPHLYNLSDSVEIFVNCPIPREATSSGGVAAHIIEASAVYVNDRDSSGNITCTIYAEKNNLSTFFSASGVSSGTGSGGGPPNPQTLSIAALNGIFDATYSIWMACNLPTVSAGNFSDLISYTIDYPG